MKIHLYLVLLSVATAWCEEMVCHEDYNFMRSWPSTKANSCNASHPHCIDTHEEIKRRCCGADATWDPEPVCSTVQYSFASSWRRQCPYGADPTSQFCIFFIRNTTYPFKCPYEEVLPFAEYVGITNRYNHLPTWVPAERNENQYGDGLYLYTEPSEMYGLALSNYTFEEPFGDKRCMIYHHTNGFEAVPCSTPHIGVCAYLALNYTTNSYCSRMFETCVSSDYPANSKCFCLSENLRDGQAELAEFLKPYQNYFRSLQRNCLIGLEQVDDEYIWISSKTKLNYTEWADDAIFGDSRKYGALTEKGWKLLRYKNETNCIIYQKDIHLEDCNLVLTYNSAKNQFFLEMSNPKAVVVSSNGTPLVFCFTDASSNELVKRLNLNGSNTFGPIHDGPGSYWCEAFVYPSVKVVKSNAVFLRDTTEEYIAIMETKYDYGYSLDAELLRIVQASLHKEVAAISSITNLTPRIYKLVSIDEWNLKITLNFHFSIKTDNALRSYNDLRYELTKLTGFQLLELLSTDFCSEVEEDGVTWLKIEVGKIAEKPLEAWCIRSDGSIMNRRCEGDFINGATWSALEEPCILQESTNITVNLTNIVNQQNPMKYIHRVAELATMHSNITEVEIDLLSEFLEQLADLDNADFNLTIHIINELMNLPESTLRLSQELYSATDRILASLDRIIEHSEFIGELNLSNLKIFSDYILNLYAIDFYEESYRKHYSPFIPTTDLDDFHCRLMFHETMKNRISDRSDLLLSTLFFKTSSLFHKSFGFRTKNIIRLIMPAFKNDHRVAVQAAFETREDGAFSCSNWHYDIGRTKGHWRHKALPVEKSTYLLCKFDILQHHAFIQVNLTDELYKIFRRPEPLEGKLRDITSFVMSFGSKFTTSEIRTIVSFLKYEAQFNVSEASLHQVINLVDELMDLPSQLLRESESEHSTSSDLLTYLKKLTENFDYMLDINKRNFYLYIGNTSTNILGFGMKHCDGNCTVELLTGVLEVDTEYELYVRINKKLFRSNRFACMIHFKNSLFPLTKNSTKVVGLLNSDIESLIVSYEMNEITTANRTCRWFKDGKWIFQELVVADQNNKYFKCLLSDFTSSYVSMTYDYVNITSTLSGIVNRISTASEHDLRIILEVLKRLLNLLRAIDIFLVSSIFSRIVYVNKVILYICMGIMDTLTTVNKDILLTAQTRYRATDNMLTQFSRLSRLLDENIEVQEANTYLSVVLLEGKNASDVEQRTFHHNMDYNFTINISEILKQGKHISKVIFIVYYNNAFFSVDQDTAYVFNVVLPEYDEILPAGIVLSVSSSSDEIQYSHCGYWNRSWVYSGEIMSSSCMFFRQGFISMITEPDFNVTQCLLNLLGRNDQDKLYQLQGVVSKYHESFTVTDLQLIAKIFKSITEKVEDLNQIVYTMNQIMKIPKEVLQKASVEGALMNLLMSINRVVTHAKPTAIFSGNFGIAKCSMCNATSITLTQNSKDDYTLSCDGTENLENVIAALDVERSLVEKNMVCEASITVFKNSELFISPKSENTNTSVIIGLSFNKKLAIGDAIRLAFNKHIFNQNSCSYWNDPDRKGKHGSWVSVAPAQIGSTKNCSFNALSYYTLTTTDLTKMLDNILTYYDKSKDRLFHTNEALERYYNDINGAVVCQVAIILSKIDILKEEGDVVKVAEITNIIAKKYRTLTKRDCTSKVLHHVDRLLGSYTGNIHLEHDEISFLTTENDGGFVLSCKEKCSVQQVQPADIAKNSVRQGECDAALQPLTSGNLAGKLKIQLFRDGILFQGGEDLSEGVIVKIDDGSDEGTDRYRMYYQDLRTGAKVQHYCGYWEVVQGDGTVSGKWAAASLPNTQSGLKSCPVQESYYFSLVKAVQNTTDDLINIQNSTATFEEKLRKVAEITTEKAQVLHPVDILIISNILGNFTVTEELTVTELSHTSTIVNNPQFVPRHVLSQSQQSYLATDNILFNLDQIALSTSSQNYTQVSQTHFCSANIKLGDDINGFMVQNDPENYYKIVYIEKGETIEQVAALPFLSAVVLSDEVLGQLSRGRLQDRRMIVNIFFMDSLFNERSERNADVSTVNGVLLPGLSGALKGDVSVFYKSSSPKPTKSCDFWNYMDTSSHGGTWAPDSSPQVINSTIICTYNHITHFAMLISNGDTNFDDPDTDYFLSLITNVNCLLSTFGLLGIVVTAVLFQRWRKNTGNQILLHFSCAISIKMVMLYASSSIYHSDGTKSVWCDITGAILHYAILSESCWMLIIAILQFKRFVEVLGGPPKYVLLKACICGWIFPALPVIILAATNKDSYTKGHLQLCYPSDLGLYLGVWLPLIMIITINCVIFIFILYNVCHKETEAREPVNHETLFQWRLALLLFSMLGLTWLFGFISLIDGATFFTYLFCFSATLQGFVMFLFFIVFNKSTRLLYMQAVKMWLYSKGYK